MEQEQKTQHPGYNSGNGRPGDNFFDWVRSLRVGRGDQRWFAGVCAGIANRAGIDPLIVRGIAVVTLLIGLPMVFLYLVGWALLPDKTGYSHVERIFRGVGTATSWIVSLLAVLGLLGEIGVRFDLGAYNFGPWLPSIIVIALIVWAIVAMAQYRSGKTGGNGGNAGDGFAADNGGQHYSRATNGNADAQGGGAAASATRGAFVAPPAGHGHQGTSWQEARGGAPHNFASAGASAEDGTADSSFSSTGGANAGSPAFGNPTAGFAGQPSMPGWQPIAPKPARKGVGAPGAAMLLGVVLLVGVVAAGVKILVGANATTGEALFIGATAALLMTGLLTVIVALRGRTVGAWSGWVGAILAPIVLTATMAGSLFIGNIQINNVKVLGDSELSSSALAQHSSRQFGIGDQTIDLADTSQLLVGKTVSVATGIGDTDVIIPADIAVKLNIRLGVGDIAQNGNRLVTSKSGTNRVVLYENGREVESFSTPEVADSAVTVNITKGIGSISLETK